VGLLATMTGVNTYGAAQNGNDFWHAESRDLISTCVAIAPVAPLKFAGTERLLPANLGGRRAVNAYLSAPGAVTGAIFSLGE
jgi:hypothetical protein